jgi:hypothetical protein
VTVRDRAIEPVLRDQRIVGLHQTATVRSDDNRSVLLDLVLEWEASDPGDTIMIAGRPPITLRIDGGYDGDLGTMAKVIRALAMVSRLPAGFYRPIDLPGLLPLDIEEHSLTLLRSADQIQ